MPFSYSETTRLSPGNRAPVGLGPQQNNPATHGPNGKAFGPNSHVQGWWGLKGKMEGAPASQQPGQQAGGQPPTFTGPQIQAGYLDRWRAQQPGQQQGQLGGAAGGLGGGTQVTSSINPTNIYNEQLIRERTNAAIAGQQEQANLPWLTSQHARPGMSQRSPGIVSQAIPQYGAALAGATDAAVNVPADMTAQNAAHQLSMQGARESEGISWANIINALKNAQQGYNTQNMTSLAGMLGQLGGLG